MSNIESNNEKYEDYFKLRGINSDSYAAYKIPIYISNILPDNKECSILDIGCGFGQMLLSLRTKGYNNLTGIDISGEAVEFCHQNNLNVEMVTDITDHTVQANKKYDLIIMSHVLEHIPKEKVIDILRYIKSNLLKTGGAFLLMVPNAQSNTGAYWMYEDFTHYTLFTAGSAIYVLKAAGFAEINFLDADGVESAGTFYGKLIRRFFLKIYNFRLDFWNKITLSSFHKPSPRIFTYELKVYSK